jgi:hypothetical protein
MNSYVSSAFCFAILAQASFSASPASNLKSNSTNSVIEASISPGYDISADYSLFAKFLGYKSAKECTGENSFWIISKAAFSTCNDALSLFPKSYGQPSKQNLKKYHSGCFGIQDLPDPISKKSTKRFYASQQIDNCTAKDSFALASRIRPQYISREVEEGLQYCILNDSATFSDTTTSLAKDSQQKFKSLIEKTLPNNPGTHLGFVSSAKIFLLGGCFSEKKLDSLAGNLDENFLVYKISHTK